MKVEGARRTGPKGEAQFQIATLQVTQPASDAPLVSAGPELELHGRFRRFAWPAGTKLEGESTLQFVVDAAQTAYFLSHGPEAPALDQPVTVRAREVVPSPYAARPGGPYLWILDR